MMDYALRDFSKGTVYHKDLKFFHILCIMPFKFYLSMDMAQDLLPIFSYLDKGYLSYPQHFFYFYNWTSCIMSNSFLINWNSA